MTEWLGFLLYRVSAVARRWGLREAWSTVDQAWAAAIERAAALPAGSVEVRIDDEWSFAETLRHLVPGIDMWLGRGEKTVRHCLHVILEEGWEHLRFRAA